MTTNPLENADFESIFARSASTITLREIKFNIVNRKISTGFLMNLR